VVSPPLNGETARLQLVLNGRDSLDTLRGKLARLEAGHQRNQRLYLDYLGAAATLVEDRARGEAGLRRVIAAADARPDATYAQLMRASAFDALVESAAAAGSASTVLALLSERLGAPRFERCVLGVASWNRLVVAAFDADGRSVLDAPRAIPEGAVMIPAAEAVSPAMRGRLARCPRIDVVAPGPYLGASRLLGDDVAWVYHTGQAGHTRQVGTPPPSRGPAAREVVISQVTPPESLHLPPLQPFVAGDGAEQLSGSRATPTSVLAAIKAASLVVIVAHGFTDASESSAASLILSPDARGDYLLTAAKVGSATLTGSPIVILAGCDAGRVQVSAEPWSLATSFLAAGARVVIAPTEPIPDAEAGKVFRSLVDRIRGGADPVEAIRAERRSRGAAAAWLSSIVVFE
jgi:cellulose synthase operon protein C